MTSQEIKKKQTGMNQFLGHMKIINGLKSHYALHYINLNLRQTKNI
jgi:hypothetical protein